MKTIITKVFQQYTTQIMLDMFKQIFGCSLEYVKYLCQILFQLYLSTQNICVFFFFMVEMFDKSNNLTI